MQNSRLKIILAFIIANLIWTASLKSQVAFYSIDIEKFTNEAEINFINQDSTGQIWLAGIDKLIRFDGIRFRSYEDALDSSDFSQRTFIHINKLFVDSRGTLYIGADNGLFAFNSEKDISIRSISAFDGKAITDLAEDEKGWLWISTRSGLAKFDPVNSVVKWVQGTIPGSEESFQNTFSDISHIECQPGGLIWICTAAGEIYRLNAETEDFADYTRISDFSFRNRNITELRYLSGSMFVSTANNGFIELVLSNEQLNHYFLDNAGLELSYFQFENDSIIWLTGNNGLFRFNRYSKKVQRFTNVPNDPLSLERTAQKFVFIDRNKNLWVSPGIRGLSFGLNGVYFKRLIVSDGSGSYQLHQKEVTSLTHDREGNLWLGYEAGRIEKHTPDPEIKYIYYPAKQDDNTQQGSILAIFADSQNNIWAGGWYVGFQKFNHLKNTFELAPVKPDSLAGLFKYADIRGFLEDKHGNIWMSLHGKGIARYNPATTNAELFAFNAANPAEGLSNNWTFNLCADFDGNIWIATAHGVTRLNPATKKFTSFFHDENSPESLSDNAINTVFCDREGNIWAGTKSGLNIYNATTKSFQPVHLPTHPGILNILSIQSVYPGEIWCGTKGGLFRLNYKWDVTHDSLLSRFQLFDHSDGLLNKSFFQNAATINTEKTLFFCGDNGIDFFEPDQIQPHQIQARDIIISDAKVEGKPVSFQYSDKNTQQQLLVLHPSDVMLEVRFSALNFPENRRKFRYILEGFNKDWVYPETENIATFTNLPAGEYTFKAGIYGKNGEWIDNEALLIIKVIPHFWATYPFLTVCFIVLILLVLHLHRVLQKIQKKREIKLEKIIEERTSEIVSKNIELENSNQTKNKFLSIISHDLRGPIAGLMGILEIMNENELPPEKLKEFISAANNSVKNTFNLLENLLLWARSQTEKIEFHPAMVDLAEIMHNNIDLILEQARQKNISVERRFEKNLNVFGDKNMIDTVFRNILNNAVKFSYPGRKIVVRASRNQKEITVSVADTGVGLSQEQTEKLFDIKTSGATGTSGEPGTGLGLIICKEFIQKNNGRIWAASNSPQGTVFHFSLPVAETSTQNG